MENHTNHNINETADILHELAIKNNTTLREVSKHFWDEIFTIVCKINKVKEEWLFNKK